MKLTLLKDIFLEKINIASKFTSSRLTTSTSLQGIYMIGEGNFIHLYSTNLNCFYHTIIKTEETHNFKIVIEPRKIIEFLSLINPGKIDIEIKEKQIILTQEKTKAEFPLFSPVDFPLPPVLDGKKQIIPSSFLKEDLLSVLFSASSDETRPVLTGVNFVSSDTGAQLVTTDGFRLSILSLKKEVSLPSMIIPSFFLSEAAKLLNNEQEIFFNYSKEEKILVFYIGQHDFYIRLIEGNYPPFEKVIPQEKKTTIIVNREDFIRNIRLVSIFARDFSNVIIIKTEKEGMRISPKTGGSEENLAFQEADIQGEEQKIAFNYKFLIDFLNNIKTKKIIIELLRSDAPTLFKPEGVKGLIHIIMPVRIQE